MSTEMIVTNARIVTRDAVVDGTVSIRDGRIAAVEPGRSSHPAATDWEGDYLLPGLIECHTDNMEKHFEPRPGVVWPSPIAALTAHDTQVAGAGITTVYDAICVGGFKKTQLRKQILDRSMHAVAIAQEKDWLKADHLVHLRCEVSDEHLLEMMVPHDDHPLVQMFSVMDHTPGQRQWTDISKYASYSGQKDWTAEDLAEAVQDRVVIRERVFDAHREAVVAKAKERAVVLASHDDTTTEHVDEAVALGMTVSEFPTTLEAARRAREMKMSIVMGSPNVVRGGSHSGNVSAIDLAHEKLLDVLSSDYVPASLLHGAFLVHEKSETPLPDAIAMVTANVADMMGLTDRGRVASELRADVIRVHVSGDFPIVREVYREGRRVI